MKTRPVASSARPGWGDKLNDEVLEAIERIEEYVEGWQTFDERGPSAGSCSIDSAAETEIQITAVVYGGREPGYCFNRRQ